jgi:hypothetical protein
MMDPRLTYGTTDTCSVRSVIFLVLWRHYLRYSRRFHNDVASTTQCQTFARRQYYPSNHSQGLLALTVQRLLST